MNLRDLLTEAGGQVDATGQLLKGYALQPVSGLGGAGRTMIDLLRGKGVGPAMEAGARTVEDIQGWGGGPFTERGAQRLGELGGMVERGKEAVGSALGNPIDRLGAIPEYGPALAAGALGFVETADPTKGAGKAAKAATRAIKKGAVDAPTQVAAPTRYEAGEKAGTYRGTEAFGGITPQKLGSMRADYLRSMEEGAPYRDWYDKASAANYRLAGERPEFADRLADIEAITSSSTPVPANLMFSAKGWNQDLVGDPIQTGQYPAAMGKRIEETWGQGSKGEGLGLKRSPYRAGLSVHWQGPESVKRATHDIHDVRAWGIKDPNDPTKPWSKGVAPAGHRFLDEQAQWAMDEANRRKLGGADDWNLHKGQAAAWVAQKAKTSGTPIEEAGRSYAEHIPDYSANLTREWTPGATSSHMPELLREMDPAKLREYNDAMEAAVRGPQGIDRLASDMGMLVDTTLPNRGVYEGNVTPGYASQLLVGKERGGQGLDPASRKAAEAVAAAHGLIGHQDQVALNFLGGDAPMRSAGAFQLGTGSPMDEAGLANVSRIAQQFGGDVAQVDPRGARVLSFHDEGDPQRMALVRALRENYPEAQVTPRARSGSLFPLKEGSEWEKPEAWSSKPYIAKIEEGGPKMVEGFNRSMQAIAPQQLAATEALAAKHGLTQAPYYRQMMEALGSRGLAGLKELVAKGIVPVSAYLMISEGMGGEEGMQ